MENIELAMVTLLIVNDVGISEFHLFGQILRVITTEKEIAITVVSGSILINFGTEV